MTAPRHALPRLSGMVLQSRQWLEADRRLSYWVPVASTDATWLTVEQEAQAQTPAQTATALRAESLLRFKPEKRWEATKWRVAPTCSLQIVKAQALSDESLARMAWWTFSPRAMATILWSTASLPLVVLRAQGGLRQIKRVQVSIPVLAPWVSGTTIL